MTVDWAHFTPLSALGGGLILGAAASALALGAGRIMGPAGILGGALDPSADDRGWRLWLIAGLLLAPGLLGLFGLARAPHIATPWATLILAGLLVGFGARLGSGCTGGHGVCGISRLSPRSIVATALFMLTGFLTVFVVRHVLA
ncbi:MAG: YeeE/YedE thiosulfate transporter family protein [Roseiarcus sp.]|jgi:uncharacterized membrane protein YedE/YeeE